MKKLIGFLLICGILTAGSALAAGVSVDVRYDDSQDRVVISAEAPGTKSNTLFTLEICDPDNNVFYADQAAADLADGKLTVSFTPVQFGINAKDGDYTVTVSAYQIGTSDPVLYDHTGIQEMFQAMSRINAAITADGDTYTAVVADGEMMKVDLSAISGLGTRGKTVFNAVMNGCQYDLPAACEDQADMEKLNAAAFSFRADYRTAVMIASFYDIGTPGAATKWIEKYKSAYALDQDDPASGYNDAEIFKYVEKVKNETVFAEAIGKADGEKTVRGVKELLYTKAILSYIAKSQFSDTRAAVNQFPSLFPYSKTAYGDLSNTKQNKVWEEFTGKMYADCAEATARIDELIAQKKGTTNGGGGGGGDNKGIMYPVTSPEEKDTPSDADDKNVFQDLDGAAWAKESILRLYEAGIISGKGEGIFAPNDMVTRAEFVKMIVSALGLDMNAEAAGFADVDAGAWYAGYLTAAKAAGIVSGDDQNRANPNSNITREDMAVMLFRACKIESTDTSLNFADSKAVSQYAQAAVAYFSKNGIISGVGDNLFAPKENATRAQAARLIHAALLQ